MRTRGFSEERNTDNACDVDALQQAVDEADECDTPPADKNENKEKKRGYVARKPKWWKVIAGRRGTKGQRKAIRRMTEKGYVLPMLNKYNHILNLPQVFKVYDDKDGQALSTNDILVSKHKDDDGNLFSEQCCLHEKKVCLEIGFGLGDNLLTNAAKFPDQFYLGSEIHQPGVGTAVMRMESAIESKNHWVGQIWSDGDDKEKPSLGQNLSSLKDVDETTPRRLYDNLRIYAGDGVKFLDFLPDKSIDEMYLTFPDPWPAEFQRDFRVIQEEVVESIAKVLKPGGCFCLATDAVVVEEWTRKVFLAVMDSDTNMDDGSRWEEVVPCPHRRLWLPAISKYEEKGIKEGRNIMTRCWRISDTCQSSLEVR